jgi:hypothetical protein
MTAELPEKNPSRVSAVLEIPLRVGTRRLARIKRGDRFIIAWVNDTPDGRFIDANQAVYVDSPKKQDSATGNASWLAFREKMWDSLPAEVRKRGAQFRKHGS